MSSSVVKMAKGRSVLSNVLNATHGSSDPSMVGVKASSGASPSIMITSEADWITKSSSVTTWIKSNPLLLGVPADGAIDCIRDQLKRGDAYDTLKARNKAWLHILLEISSCAGAEVLGNLFANDLSSTVGDKLDVVFGKGGSNLVVAPAATLEQLPQASTNDENTEPSAAAAVPTVALAATTPAPTTAAGSKGGGAVTGGGAKSIFALRAAGGAGGERENDGNEVAGDEAAPILSIAGDLTAEADWTATAPTVAPKLNLKISNMGASGQSIAAPGSQSARKLEAGGEFSTGLSLNVANLARGNSGALSARDSPMKEENVVEKAKAAAQMTMIERQAVWLAKKAKKASEQRKIADDAVRASIMDKPDIGASKKSFTGVKAKVEAGLLAAAVISAANAEKEKRAVAEAQQQKPQEAKKEQPIKKKPRSKSVSAVPTSNAVDADAANNAAFIEIFSPTTAISSKRNSCSDINQYDIGNYNADERNTALIAGEAFPVMRVGTSASTPTLQTTNVDSFPCSSAEVATGKEQSCDFKTGSFFTRIDSDSNRGHFRVRDGAAFSMASMYRKRDKYSKMGTAVALLVGREENGAADEKAIEVLFDLGAMNEEAAKKWWDANQERFLTPRK